MIWGVYLLIIPLVLILFIIGLASYSNKFELNTNFLDFTENIYDKEKEAEKQKKRNKIIGIILMLFSIVVLFIPIIFQ